MYSLFNEKSSINRGTRQPPQWKMVRNRLRKNIIDVLRHIRTNRYSVANDHLLVKLLSAMRPNPDLDVYEYHRMIAARAPAVSRSQGLTSSLWRNNSNRQGIFYGRNSEEVYLYVENDIDFLSLENNWRSLTPITVLRHPRTDMSIEMLDGRLWTKENGLCIIAIDPIMLAMQYYYFIKQEGIVDDTYLTYGQFVYKYPLANMLMSHHDVAFMNRLIALYDGKDVTSFENGWPITVRDYTSQVDRYLIDRINTVSLTQQPHIDTMRQIQTPIGDYLGKLVRLPSVPITRQNLWVLIAARIPIITFLCKLDFDTGNTRNTQNHSTIRKEIRETMSDRSMFATLSPSLNRETTGTIRDDIYDILL